MVNADTSNLPRPSEADIGALAAMLTDVDDDHMGKNPAARSYLSSEIEQLKKGDTA